MSKQFQQLPQIIHEGACSGHRVQDTRASYQLAFGEIVEIYDPNDKSSFLFPFFFFDMTKLDFLLYDLSVLVKSSHDLLRFWVWTRDPDIMFWSNLNSPKLHVFYEFIDAEIFSV